MRNANIKPKTMENVKNPFLVTGYLSPEYFCDREKETERIISAMDNNRNITLLSLRRMGKTGLIKNVFYYLKKERPFRLLYVDIMATNNMAELVRELGNAVIREEKERSANFLNKLITFLSGIRAKIVFNDITGMPEIEVDYRMPQEAEKGLAALFDYLESQKVKYVVAIDEFQQIVNYAEKNVEALLRSNVQQLTNVNFIFSGSNKHLLMSMFSDYGRPFYQSSDFMFLDRLDQEVYADFILKQFVRFRRTIDKELVLEVLRNYDTYTFYTQFMFNRIFETGVNNITRDLVEHVKENIMLEREYVYYNYRNLLTDNQFNLLRALAKENGFEKYMSKDFLAKYKLGQASSVQRSIKALLDKEMIYEEKGCYKVYDVFFSKWLSV